MLNHLENHFNKTETTNGAEAFVSTKSSVLDLFSRGGAMRGKDDSEIATLFSKAFAENPLLAMKTIFYLRDIRGGQGERNIFKVAIQHLATHNQKALEKNLHLVSEFGRWDDLWVLLDTPVKDSVLNLVAEQLVKDKHSETPSLLGKWMPSENASSYTTKKYATIIRKYVGGTPKQYRKLLTSLRAKISILETKITEKNYSDIDYSKIPSVAGMKYRGAFYRNDETRYNDFLESLVKGEVKINASTLYPSDIVGKILNNRYQSTSSQDVKLFEGQWENLPNFIGDKTENSLVMADVSGSMMVNNGLPMATSIALAMYIAERNKGVFHNHFMTFSTNPSLVKIQGGNIVEKVSNICRANWDMSTNIEKALQTLLDVAVDNNLDNEDVIKKLYIISDMQFDGAVRGATNNIFNNLRKEFEAHGYDFPNIVFWNVNAYGNSPMTMNEVGIQLVSGYSPSIVTQLLNSDGKTPYEFMLDVIDVERYSQITV